MSARILSLCASVFVFSSCANFNTLGRQTDLPTGGLAIHLDAPQRLVYVNKDGTICAEPRRMLCKPMRRL